ncbi:MAG TPA: mycothiol system anti-sigma-R factor [Actinomycetota bacterium]|nr:mycothiol system anti-sigma-R factor [Actinomycetota bacterium]
MSSIDCQDVLKQIELYLDGELDPSLRSQVSDHLGRCSPCMSHSEFTRHLRELLRAKCGCGEVPDHVMDRVREVLFELPGGPAPA